MLVISVPEGPIADENNNPTPTFVHFVNALAKLEPVENPTSELYPQIAEIEGVLETINAGVVDKNVITKFFGTKTAGVNLSHGLNRDDIDFVPINQSSALVGSQKFYEADENNIYTDFDTDILTWKFD